MSRMAISAGESVFRAGRPAVLSELAKAFARVSFSLGNRANVCSYFGKKIHTRRMIDVV